MGKLKFSKNISNKVYEFFEKESLKKIKEIHLLSPNLIDNGYLNLQFIGIEII